MKYVDELNRSTALNSLLNRVLRDDVTLVYSSRNDRHNNAVILWDYLNKKIARMEREKARLTQRKMRETEVREKARQKARL